jgi:hypothetical protein
MNEAYEGGHYAILLLVDFSNSHCHRYLCCTKFECCTRGHQIPYLEIPDLSGLYHLRVDWVRSIVRPSFLDSKGLTSIVSVEKVKSRDAFDLTIVFGKPHHKE